MKFLAWAVAFGGRGLRMEAAKLQVNNDQSAIMVLMISLRRTRGACAVRVRGLRGATAISAVMLVIMRRQGVPIVTSDCPPLELPK